MLFGSGVSVAVASAAVLVQTLSQKLPYAIDTAIKKKKIPVFNLSLSLYIYIKHYYIYNIYYIYYVTCNLYSILYILHILYYITCIIYIYIYIYKCITECIVWLECITVMMEKMLCSFYTKWTLWKIFNRYYYVSYYASVIISPVLNLLTSFKEFHWNLI